MCKEGFVAVVELSGAWRPGLGMEMLECQHPLTSAQLTVQRQSCALANMHVITLSAPAPPPPTAQVNRGRRSCATASQQEKGSPQRYLFPQPDMDVLLERGNGCRISKNNQWQDRHCVTDTHDTGTAG